MLNRLRFLQEGTPHTVGMSKTAGNSQNRGCQWLALVQVKGRPLLSSQGGVGTMRVPSG